MARTETSERNKNFYKKDLIIEQHDDVAEEKRASKVWNNNSHCLCWLMDFSICGNFNSLGAVWGDKMIFFGKTSQRNAGHLKKRWLIATSNDNVYFSTPVRTVFFLSSSRLRKMFCDRKNPIILHWSMLDLNFISLFLPDVTLNCQNVS